MFHATTPPPPFPISTTHTHSRVSWGCWSSWQRKPSAAPILPPEVALGRTADRGERRRRKAEEKGRESGHRRGAGGKGGGEGRRRKVEEKGKVQRQSSGSLWSAMHSRSYRFSLIKMLKYTTSVPRPRPVFHRLQYTVEAGWELVIKSKTSFGCMHTHLPLMA